MDKNAIKKYAVWARRELISRVSQRAALYEITEKGYGDANAVSVLGRVMSVDEKAQRGALIDQIREKGYEQVMEEIAYTWFNRFIALRFMEVNGYLPSHVRVFTDEENRFKPQILTEAINVELDGLDMEKVYALKTANDDDTLFKYLIIVQCNALSSILPGMFQRISDYTEILFPDNLLREGSVIEQMVSMIPEEDWTDQVQIIGWLYQYYNTEPKDKVFADLKKNIKISKENIPAATQLFTPDWIVRYMVENSLGRLWLEGHPNDALRAGWKYYLDEAEQEPDVQKQLAEIRKEYATLKPEEIKVIDPCCGSGHILAYMFDVLVQIYEAYGYSAREAVAGIVGNNIWGLDIDDRAAQLAYFSVMMKARQYDRRFFSRGIQPHVYAIEESNGLTTAPLHDMGLELTQDEYAVAVKQAWRLIEETRDAKEYGSIINVTPCDWDLLRRFAIPRWESEGGQIPMEIHGEIEAAPRLQNLTNIGQALGQKYHAVVTNPPYMSSSNMGPKLLSYVKSQYSNSKNDLFAVFIERCFQLTRQGGLQAMITQNSWMFLSSFERLRLHLVAYDLINALHLGPRAFDAIGGEVVQTISFCMRKATTKDWTTVFMKLTEGNSESEKLIQFLENKNTYYVKQKNFEKIVGAPYSYWVSDTLYSVFEKSSLLSTYADPRQGLATGNDEDFLRLWHEIDLRYLITDAKDIDDFWNRGGLYAPFNKGGSFRKWYGNNDYVIRFNKSNYITLSNQGNKLPSKQYYFKAGITWNALTSGLFSGRLCEEGYVFAGKGPMCFPYDKKNLLWLCAFMNSNVFNMLMRVFSATMDFNQGPMRNVPMVIDDDKRQTVEALTKRCVQICKQEWDSYETSWEFYEHPLITAKETLVKEGKPVSIANAFEVWKQKTEEWFEELKNNEEKLNSIFIDIYGLNDELSPSVDEKDITVHKANVQREIRSFISYAVGCIFGRYTLGKKEINCSDGEWPIHQNGCITPDKDAIVPICDDEYFEDDISSLFISFVEVTFGRNLLEDNLKFIAKALGGKATPRETIKNYFINEFYADHLKIYQKRPIYWLFDSGKKNGFKCLIYMHRYHTDTIARIRTDYVHEQQSRYRTAIADLEKRIAGAETGERLKLAKQLAKLQEQAAEIREYEEKIHHIADQMISMDLDKGVKHNYHLFADVLAKLK